MASSRSTREKAAQARAEQLAAEDRSRRRRIVGGAALVLLLIVAIGVAVLLGRPKADDTALALPAPNPAAALPKGVLGPDSPTPYAVPAGDAPASAKTVQVWEDFQCPFCATFEAAQGADVTALAASGDVRVVYRIATFLDDKFPQSRLSSARAANAWGAAIDAGKGDEFRALVFANQPKDEGVGFTDEQLVELGRQAGITGADLDAFATKVAEHTYFGWVANSSEAFRASAVPSTPNVIVDGQEVPSQYLQSGLVDYIRSTTGG
ncbi:MAG: thioredoxin domain-containing protein [Candidatus Nanopelagicales bacterium]